MLGSALLLRSLLSVSFSCRFCVLWYYFFFWNQIIPLWIYAWVVGGRLIDLLKPFCRLRAFVLVSMPSWMSNKYLLRFLPKKLVAAWMIYFSLFCRFLAFVLVTMPAWMSIILTENLCLRSWWPPEWSTSVFLPLSSVCVGNYACLIVKKIPTENLCLRSWWPPDWST